MLHRFSYRIAKAWQIFLLTYFVIQSTLEIVFPWPRPIARLLRRVQTLLYKVIEAPVRFVNDRIRPSSGFPHTLAELRGFPEGSVGRELANFLDARGFRLIPNYENHDILHLLLDYDTDVVGEYKLHFFQWGNGHRSFLTRCTMLVGILTMPDQWAVFDAALARGRRTPGRLTWLPFNELAARNLEEVRRELGLAPEIQLPNAATFR